MVVGANLFAYFMIPIFLCANEFAPTLNLVMKRFGFLFILFCHSATGNEVSFHELTPIVVEANDNGYTSISSSSASRLVSDKFETPYSVSTVNQSLLRDGLVTDLKTVLCL